MLCLAFCNQLKTQVEYNRTRVQVYRASIIDDVDEVTGRSTRSMHLQGLCNNTKSIKPDASTRSARPLEDPDKLMAGAYRIVTTTLLPTLRRVTEH